MDFKYTQKGKSCRAGDLDKKNQNNMSCVPGKGAAELPIKGVKEVSKDPFVFFPLGKKILSSLFYQPFGRKLYETKCL